MSWWRDPKRQHVERGRYLQSEPALRRVRADLQVYGVVFDWDQEEHRRASGLIEHRLMAWIRGQVDPRMRSIPKGAKVDKKLNALQHNAYQAGAFAMTLISPLFENACVMGGSADPSGSWAARLWLDPTDGQLEEIEAAQARG